MKLISVICLIIGTIFILSSFNQSINKDDIQKRDSLIIEINQGKDRKEIQKNIIRLINTNYLADPKFVIDYVEKNVLGNSKFMTDTVFYATVINTYSTSFFYIDLHKCAEYAKMGIDYIGDNQNPDVLEWVALLTSNLANTTGALGYNMTKLKMLVDLSPIIFKVKDQFIKTNYHHRLGGMYYEFNELDKAIHHLKLGIFDINDLRLNNAMAGVTELVIASSYVKLNKLDSVKKYTNLTEIRRKPEFHNVHLARLKHLQGLCEGYEGRIDKALILFEEGKKLAKEAQDESEIMYSDFMKAKVFDMQKSHHKAIELYNSILKDTPKKDLDSYHIYILRSLIDSYISINDYQKSNEIYKQLFEFLEEEKIKNQDLYIEELNYNFKFNEKLNELDKLKVLNEKSEITKQRNTLFIFTLLISLILISVILFFVLKAAKKNKILSKQNYELLAASLEEEKSNRLIDEMKLLMQIEDRERNRIATDLHDSIGGLLSSIKIAIYNFQESRELSDADIEETDRILAYLDESKQELNRIVYNLTPLIVEKFGLLEAIKQYCKKIQNDKFKIDLQLISMPADIIIEDEITLFRIIQEAMHNIVKHSMASQALLQIQSFENGKVMISIEDNGRGMDLEKMNVINGIGLKSLSSRVHALNGTLKIQSKIGDGTIIYISCNPRKMNDQIKESLVFE